MSGYRYDPIYEAEDEFIVHKYQLDTGRELKITAEDIRKERTGKHAKITILMNQRIIGSDNFNYERDGDRLRLANSAHKQLSEVDASVWPANHMKHALDQFVHRLWEFHVGQAMLAVTEYDYDNEAPLSQPKYLLYPHVIEGAGTILFGEPGKGKTWTAMIMAACMEFGLTFPWRVERSIRTLYVNLERDAGSMEQRMRLVYDALGVQGRGQSFLHARGRSLSDVSDVIRATVKKKSIECIVLDSISRAGYGDLKEDSTANKAMDALNSFGCAWIAIGHTPRADTGHLFGSQMFDAAADIIASLISDDTNPEELGVEVRQTKNNHASKAKSEILAYAFDDWGLASVQRASSGDFAELDAKRKKKPKERVYELLASGPMTPAEISKELGLDRSFVGDICRRGLNATELGFTSPDGRSKKYHLLSKASPENEEYSSIAPPQSSEGEGGGVNLLNYSSIVSTPQWDPCGVCNALEPPERYTSDGRPLCRACATEA